MAVLTGQPQLSLWKMAAGQNRGPPRTRLGVHNSLIPVCTVFNIECVLIEKKSLWVCCSCPECRISGVHLFCNFVELTHVQASAVTLLQGSL